MESLIFSLTNISPIFIIIGIGAFARRIGLIDTQLCERLTRLVFFIFLPALLLRSTIRINPASVLTPAVFGVILFTILANYLLAWTLSTIAGKRGLDRGMFASGSCWGNVAIIGYALGEAVYGEAGLQRAVLFSGVVLPIHMFIGYASMGRSFLSMLRPLAGNPVILALLCGYLVRFFSIPIPTLAMNILEILGRASLPLALIAIGGSLEFVWNRQVAESLAISTLKLLVMPALAFTFAVFFGLTDSWVGSLVVGFSCPVAVSFFVISRSFGIEASRGAAVITATHIIASVSTGLIATLLKATGYL